MTSIGKRRRSERNRNGVYNSLNENQLTNRYLDEDDDDPQVRRRKICIDVNEEVLMDASRPMRTCRILQHNYNENLIHAAAAAASATYQAPLNRTVGRRGRPSKKKRERRRGLDNDSSGSSSSTSSSSSSDDEEQIKTSAKDYKEEARFERRKLRSLQKSRKDLMPMNFTGLFFIIIFIMVF